MCNKEGEINMKEMTNSNTNVFLDVLYNKPILDPSAGFFKKIAYKFRLRKTTAKIISQRSCKPLRTSLLLNDGAVERALK